MKQRGNSKSPHTFLARVRVGIRYLCWFAVLLAIGSAALGVYIYLRPVRALAQARQIRNSLLQLVAEPQLREAQVTDYHPLELASAGQVLSDRRLIERPYSTEDEGSLHLVRVDLDGESRNAVVAIPTTSFSYQLEPQPLDSLRFEINRDEDSLPSACHFEISIVGPEGETTVFQQELLSDHIGWEDHRVDLSAFAGEAIEVRFSVTADAVPRDDDKGPLRVYWSDLYLAPTPDDSGQPNVVVILVDTLRPDHLGCYGYSRPTSPRIDQMASEGVRFASVISSSSWTNPSILTLLTGLYPGDLWPPKPHREMIRYQLPPQSDTLAEHLAAAGYFTIAASDHPGIRDAGFGAGFDVFRQLSDGNGLGVVWSQTEDASVLKQLRNLLGAIPSGPIFVYLHIIYPHVPYVPPKPYDTMFGRGVFHFNPDNLDKREQVINMYDGEIRHTDDFLTKFLDHLREVGLEENTVLVLLSDHGEGFWEHGLFEHGNSLYNELLRVPLIFRAPGRFPSGRVVEEPVRSVDIFPTILELAGIEHDPQLRGQSLLSLIEGRSTEEKRSAYSEFPHSNIVKGRALQSADEKIILPNTSGQEMKRFDLAVDPGEQKDLGQDAVIESSLLPVLEEIADSSRERRAQNPPKTSEPSPDVIEKLKSLGYIQ